MSADELFALRVRCERAPILQFLHARRQRNVLALNVLRGACGKTMQQPLGLAFETGRTREMARVDLRLEFADAVVQAAQQLFVDRVTCRVELRQAAAQRLGAVEQRTGGAVRSAMRCARSFV